MHSRGKLKLIKTINILGYIFSFFLAKAEIIQPEEGTLFGHKSITREMLITASGQKGKLAFLNSKGEACSTEAAFKDQAELQGWQVMRAEVTFWQAMFCLVFWDEIFYNMGQPSKTRDIPRDLFSGMPFYLSRKKAIDRRYKQIRSLDVCNLVNKQIKKSKGAWTRLIYDGGQDMLAHAKSDIAQTFFKKVDPEIFAKIVYRIAQNPTENRSGLTDFIIWNDNELKMIEVKKVREQIRPSQLSWIAWMVDENIPVEIVRIKAK